MLNEKFVARIDVWDNEGNKYVGTGYPISSTLVMTAKHVIEPDERDDSRGINIVWSECDQDNENLPIDNKTIIYDGEGQYDLVLLRCKTPISRKNAPTFAYAFPQQRQQYQCRGFPLAGEDDDGHDAIPVPGEVIGGYSTPRLDLLAKTDMNTEDDWAGLSGAPVFINDLLYAVIKVKYSTVKKYLYAVSIPYLIKNSVRFRQAVGVNKIAIAERQTKELQQVLITQIDNILCKGNIPLRKLSKYIAIDNSVSSIEMAAYLVTELRTLSAAEKLLELSIALEESLRLQKQWQHYLFDIEQLCGWLLLNSVDPQWWLEHGQDLLKTTQLSNTLPLENPPYIEVIISRDLLQRPCLTLDTYNDLVPQSSENEVLLFDASPEASSIQILSRIFKDLKRSESAPQKVDRLLNGILKTGRTLYKARGKKIIYYLISVEYLTLLQKEDWYAKAEQNLSSYLQFICCDVGGKQQEQQLCPCDDDQDDLLETIAAIMRLQYEKGVANA